MKKFLMAVMSILPLSYTAYAAEPMPEKGIERIWWAARCCGNAPAGMYVSLGILAALIIISIVYYKSVSGGGGNEKKK